MHISMSIISEALQSEDIESLIEFGAPSDEYNAEAELLFEALGKLGASQINEVTIAAVLAGVWAKMFNRNADEIRARLPAFQSVARRILGV